MIQNILKIMILYVSKKIVKNYKKYKIWSPNICYYEDNVERFGSTVRTLKTEIKDVENIETQNHSAFEPSYLGTSLIIGGSRSLIHPYTSPFRYQYGTNMNQLGYISPRKGLVSKLL